MHPAMALKRELTMDELSLDKLGLLFFLSAVLAGITVGCAIYLSSPTFAGLATFFGLFAIYWALRTALTMSKF